MSHETPRLSDAAPDSLASLQGEYAIIKAEMQTYIGLFHQQANFSFLYLTVVAGALTIGGAVLSANDTALHLLTALWSLQVPGVKLDFALYQVLAFLANLLIAVSGFLFVAASYSYIYVIELLAHRAAVVEDAINTILGARVMSWELDFSPRLVRGLVRHRYWFSPSAIRISWSFCLLVIVLLAQLAFAVPMMGSFLGHGFQVLTLVGTAFSLSQVFGYHRIGVPLITKVTEEIRVRNQLSLHRDSIGTHN